MGRFLRKLWNGVKKAGRWIGNAASKVGSVANVLSGVPVIGGIASTVAKGAGLVNKIATGATNFMDKVDQKRQQYQPVIDKVKEAGKAIHQSGIADKLTRGGFTRVINKGRAIRDRIERRYDRAEGRIGQIGRRINGGLDKAQNMANTMVGGRGAPPPPAVPHRVQALERMVQK